MEINEISIQPTPCPQPGPPAVEVARLRAVAESSPRWNRRRKSGDFSYLGFSALVLAWCAATASSAGCGKASRADEQQARALMRMVGIEYGRYLANHNGQPPQEQPAFLAFLDVQISKTPNYGVSSAAELLTSPRDGQPLVVIYRKTIAPPDQPDTPWAACEKTGVDGQRLVVNARGLVTEMPSADVDQLVAHP